MGLLDRVKQGWGAYQGALPDWATKDYYLLPEADIPMGNTPIMPGGFTPQGMYDFGREMLSVNPSIDAPLGAAGGIAGRLLKAAKAARMAKQGSRAYQGALKPSRVVGSSPLEGWADNAAGTIRGNIEQAPRFGDDFRAMDDLDDLERSVPDPWVEGIDNPNGYAEPFDEKYTQLRPSQDSGYMEFLDELDDYDDIENFQQGLPERGDFDPDLAALVEQEARSDIADSVDLVSARNKMNEMGKMGADPNFNLADEDANLWNRAWQDTVEKDPEILDYLPDDGLMTPEEIIDLSISRAGEGGIDLMEAIGHKRPLTLDEIKFFEEDLPAMSDEELAQLIRLLEEMGPGPDDIPF
jgi:hypothetical protein